MGIGILAWVGLELRKRFLAFVLEFLNPVLLQLLQDAIALPVSVVVYQTIVLFHLLGLVLQLV